MKLFWKISLPVFLSFVIAAIVIATVVTRAEIARQEAYKIAVQNAMVTPLVGGVEKSLREGQGPPESLKCLSDDDGFLFWWVAREDGVIHLASDGEAVGTRVTDHFDAADVPNGETPVRLLHGRGCGLLVRPIDVDGRHWTFWTGFSLKDIAVMRRRAVLLALAVFVPTLAYLAGVLYLTVRRFTRPVEVLSRAAAHVGRGDLDRYIEVTSHDELGQLAEAFNRMTEDLRATTVSRDYVDDIVRSMDESLVVVGPDGTIAMVNRATCDLLGYVEDDLVGREVDLLFDEEIPGDADATSSRLLRRRIVNHETSYRTRNGRRVPVLFSSTPVHDGDGDLDRVVCTARDVSEVKSTREALREGEAKYRAVVEDLPVLVCRFRPDGTITFVNDMYCDTFDKPREELVGSDFATFLPEEDRSSVREQLALLGPDNPMRTYEHKVINVHGEVRWQRWTDRAICDEDGRVVSFQSIGQDITDRKRAEEEKASLARFPGEAPNPVMRMRADGTLVYANEASRFLLEKIGCRVGDVVPERWRELLDDALSAGVSRQVDADFSDHAFQLCFAPVSESGYVNLYAQDITHRKIAETERQKFVSLIENSNDLICMATLEGKVFYMNHAGLDLVGLDGIEDVFGRKVWELSPPETWEQVRSAHFGEMMSEGHHRSEIQLRHQRTGERIDVLLSTFLVRDPHTDTPMCAAAIMRDITDHKLAVEQVRSSRSRLEEANRQLQANQNQLIQSEKLASIGQLAAGVAHEINNPVGFVMSNLGTLTGYVDTFKEVLARYDRLAGEVTGGNGVSHDETLDDIETFRRERDLAYILEDVDGLLAESSDGVERIRDIVQGLKSFARVDEEQIKEADINDCLEVTLKIVWNELQYKCAVHRNFGELPLIRCNPGQLNQVFMNLLVNAAQAIPEHGDVTITTVVEDDCVVVRIADNGKGVDPEHLSRLFDPFFTTKEVGQGTGLGLAISHGIIQKHHGTIEVDSKPGSYTTFTVRLPIEGDVDE